MIGASMLDNYELDEDVEDEMYSLSDKMVHYIGGEVLPEHWNACKAVLVFQAGCLVSKLNSMTKANMQLACLDAYKSSVSELDSIYFSTDSRIFFMASFRNKDQPMTGDALYRNFQESRKKMRMIIIPLLPASFTTMKSGKGFHETCNDLVVTLFRREVHKGTVAKPGIPWSDAEQLLPPHMWEYKKPPWSFLLCVKIFRKHIQLAPNVADVMDDVTNIVESRDIVKRNAQVAAYRTTQHKKKRANTAVNSSRIKKEFPDDEDDNRFVCPSDSASSSTVMPSKSFTVAVRSEAVIAAETDRKHNAWAKVHMAKAIEENANVAKKMAEFDAIEKKLMLLERFRGVMEDAEYNARVKEVLDTMPETKLFAKQCEVVCIGEESPHDNPAKESLRNTVATTKNDEAYGKEKQGSHMY
ncbi:hypothetical protein MHU86_2121 [Fragilaria crotonensis]|nr:hypothetical protein MHU86_2121 [Fragilaria crotonensis]